jgi:anaerobic magnesium-protoporphyrin IX monomethyl ester cyclase
MKIALVNPPYGVEDLVGKSKSLKGIMNIVQPLGLGYIASVLEKNGYDVGIEDCQCFGDDHQTLINKLRSSSPDIVGISATTPTFGSGLIAAQLVKQNLPNATVVMGGAHVSALPEETMAYDCFDVGVIGEGEYTTLELVKHLEKSGLSGLEQIPGIAFKKNGSFRATERRPFIKDLDELPLPARHLLPPLSMYHPAPTSYRRLPNAHLLTTRGCAGARCLFCDQGVFGFQVRFRSVENIFAEIEELINVYGARDLKFFDDTFTLDKKRVLKVCEEFKRRKIDVPWCCLARANTVNREILKAMKEAGCWEILFGFESMDQNVLTKLMKFTTVEQNIEAVKLCNEIGINVRGNFVVGSPFDTLDTMETDLREAMKLNMGFAHFNKFTPYPGSALYRMLSEQGYKWDFTKWESQLDMKGSIMYTPNGLTEEQYRDWLVKAHKRYYLRPRYMMRQLTSVRSGEDVKRLWQGMCALAFL